MMDKESYKWQLEMVRWAEKWPYFLLYHIYFTYK